MQFQPSREQRELAESMDDAIATILPINRWHDRDNESKTDWRQLTDLGLFDIARRIEAGGMELGAVEEVLIAMALGRQLAAPSVFATLGAVHATPIADALVWERVAAAIGSTNGLMVLQDDAAETVLVRTQYNAELRCLEAGCDTLAGNPWIDRLARPSSPGQLTGTFDIAARLRLTLIDAAALTGLAEAALAEAVEYSKLREQFGRPIGSFQAIKHHCANMAVATRSASDLVTFAAVAIEQQRFDAAFLVDSAFIVAAEAAISNAAKNVQIHGGIGFSAEADAHLFVKRAQLLVAWGGGVEASIDRVAVSDLGAVV